MIKRLIFIPLFFIAFIASAQKVTLDYYFNRETHKAKDGVQRRFHYLWDDSTNAGFSIWGSYFKKAGATLDSLNTAPTTANLKGTGIYIIVDPDSKKESPKPNFMTEKDAGQIAEWVQNGGVLVMMANDSANCDLEHFNILAAKFNMRFNTDLQNHVVDDKHFEDGMAIIANGKIFNTASAVFLKDVCSIKAKRPAKAVLLAANGARIAVSSTFGKGAVFAVGDPWLYNEYVNGRLPKGFENDKAAADLAKWLVAEAKK